MAKLDGWAWRRRKSRRGGGRALAPRSRPAASCVALVVVAALGLGWSTSGRAETAWPVVTSAKLRSAPHPVSPAPPPSVTSGWAHLHATLHHGFQIPLVVWRPDGSELAVAEWWGRTIRLWDMRTGSPSGTLHELDVQIDALAYSPDGQRLAAALVVHMDRQSLPSLVFWDMSTRRIVKRFMVPVGGRPLTLNGLAYTQDGRHLAIVLGYRFSTALYDVSAGTLKPEVPTPANTGPVQIDPSGQWLAYPSVDPREGHPVKLVRLADGSTITGDVKHGDHSKALAFEPSGRRLAVGDSDGAITVYDVRTGRAERRMQGHDRAVQSVQYQRGGDRLVSAAPDGVRVWNVRTGAEVSRCRLDDPFYHRIVISPAGERVATGGPNEVRVWDVCREPR